LQSGCHAGILLEIQFVISLTTFQPRAANSLPDPGAKCIVATIPGIDFHIVW